MFDINLNIFVHKLAIIIELMNKSKFTKAQQEKNKHVKHVAMAHFRLLGWFKSGMSTSLCSQVACMI